MFIRKISSFCITLILLIALIILSAVLIGCSMDLAGQPGIPTESNTDQGEAEGRLPPEINEWILPIVVSITDDQDDIGMATAWGFSHGVNVVNEQGGIRETPVTISVRDASSDSQVTTEMGSVAIDALVALGPPTEELYKAGQQAFYTVGMPVIGAATDRENRVAYEPFSISCITDPGSETISATSSWIKAERFSSVCMIYAPIFLERSESAKETLLQSGIAIAGEYMLGNEGFDAALVAEEAYDLNANAYYIDLSGEDTLRIIRQLRFIAGDSASKLKILCGPGAADKELLESAEEGTMIGVRVWTTVDPNKDAEKRKAFDEAFEKDFEDSTYYSIAVDYYQSALMLKQAIEALGLTGSSEYLAEEREALARFLYNSGMFTTDQGSFAIVDGNKETAATLYKITENGLQ